MTLQNKVALITGGANGMGKEMALRLAARGARVGSWLRRRSPRLVWRITNASQRAS